MNIIDINYKELQYNINEYILNNNENIFTSHAYIHVNKPIILMNEKTLKFLQEKSNEYINNPKEEITPMIFGCCIAIASWLPFGEVKLR